MAIVRTIAVSIVARTRKFLGQMQDASKSVNRFDGAVRTARKGMRLWQAAIAAVTVGVAAQFVRANLDAIDSLDKMSEKVGVTVAELQTLRFAGEQTGVAINTLDMAIQRMVRRVSEAAKGTGEAKDAIKELGLDARTLAELDPAKQFRMIADAMKGVENQGDRVRLAMRLFDSEGVALVNTLALGSEGLDAFGSELDRLGVLLDEAAVQRAVEAKEAMNRLGTAWSGLSQQLTTELSPALTQLAEDLTEIIGRTDKAADRYNALFLEGVSTALGMNLFTDAALDVADALRGADEEVERITVDVQDLAEGQAEAARAAEEETAALKAQADALKEAARAHEALERAAKRVFENTRTPLERYEAELEKLNELMEKGLIDPDTFARAVAAAKRELERLTTVAEDVPGLAPTGGATEEARRGGFRTVRDLSRVAVGGDPANSAQAGIHGRLDKMQEQFERAIRAIQAPTELALR